MKKASNRPMGLTRINHAVHAHVGVTGKSCKNKRALTRADTLATGGPGSYVVLIKEAKEKFPTDPFKQTTYVLGKGDLQAHTGRRRSVSEATRTSFGKTLMLAIADLKKLRMPIQQIDQIGRKQAVALVAYWALEKGQSAATLTTKLSQLRKFCVLIGKPDAIPMREDLYALLEAVGVDRSALTREQVTPGSKNWSSVSVDPKSIIAQIAIEHPHEALLLELMLYWGLRVSEALSLRPQDSDIGSELEVTRGTKGGRARMVPYMTDPSIATLQRDLLDRCLGWSKAFPKLGMGYRNLTMEAARKKFYNTMEKLGITLEGLGVTPHGLRHEFAANLFNDITGHRPPAEGNEPPDWFKANRQLVEDAYKRVSRALGHTRPDISSAYLGSVTKMSKLQKERVERWVQLVEKTPGVAQALMRAGVERAWLTGRAAKGLDIHPEEQVHLTVQIKPDFDRVELGVSMGVLDSLLSGRVLLVLLHGENQPDGGAEVFFKA